MHDNVAGRTDRQTDGHGVTARAALCILVVRQKHRTSCDDVRKPEIGVRREEIT